MSTKRSLLERAGPRVQTREAGRVPFGSSQRLLLRPAGPAAPDTSRAARVLARRHLSLKKTHAVLTKMIESGQAVLEVPAVEDTPSLARELEECGVAALRHEPPARMDVKGIRERLGISQEDFALRYGLDLDTVRNWEQGRSKPDRASRTVLWMIATNPEAVSASLDRAVQGE